MSPSCELRGGGVTQNTKLYTYALIARSATSVGTLLKSIALFVCVFLVCPVKMDAIIELINID